MSKSEIIRYLLTHFPGLKPKEIERLLGEHGVAVDANLIGVARLRHRRDQQAERALFRLLASLLDKRPDLVGALQASFDDLSARVVQIVAAHPGLNEGELIDVLAAEFPERPAEETMEARLSRIFLAVLELHPDHRRAMELRLGTRPGGIEAVVVKPKGVTDDLTDEQIAAVILRYLQENCPAGPTAEAVARAFLDLANQRAASGAAEQKLAERAENDRAVRIWAAVLSRWNADHIDHEAALGVVQQQFIIPFPDWTDEEIVDRIISGFEHVIEREDRDDRHVEGLTIRSRL